MYFFSWEKIPGNDNERLKDFLMHNFKIEWVKSAKIEKTNNGKTIILTGATNFLSLTLNDKQTLVNLKIDDDRNDKFIAKTEKDGLNIYVPEKITDLGSGIEYILKYYLEADFKINHNVRILRNEFKIDLEIKGGPCGKKKL